MTLAPLEDDPDTSWEYHLDREEERRLDEEAKERDREKRNDEEWRER